MPPSSLPQNDEKLLPPGHPPAGGSSAGPVIGIIVIIALLILGALYFWGAHLNAQNQSNNIPYIPADNSTSTAY